MSKSILKGTFLRTLCSADHSGTELRASVLLFTSLAAAFALVGGARDDLLSLLIWRPLSAVIFGLALATGVARAWARHRSLMLYGLAVALITAVQIIPLPPSVWTAFSGRDMIADTFRDAGMPLPWQPVSLVPFRTWNALFSLMAPLSTIMLMACLATRRQRVVLKALLVIGLLSGLIGMIQVIGPSNGPLYFYEITNNGLGVGLFANRNHQAAFLASLYPLLAANLSLFKGRPDTLFFNKAVTLAGACLLFVFILMTGSRSGLVLAVVGCGAAWILYRPPTSEGRVVGIRNRHKSRLIGLGLVALLLFLGVLVASQTPAVDRLLQTDTSGELRVQALPSIFKAIVAFFPVGTGFGTFVEVYQIFEPDPLITASYFNHAHNDYAEWILTGGLAGAILLGWAALLAVAGGLALLRRGDARETDEDFAVQVLGRAGFSVLAILALASVTDYQLRVPSLLMYASIAAVWCSNAVNYRRIQS